MIAAWAVRAVRGLWPDRNPLRRTVDRAEAGVVAALAVAFLAGAPLAAVAAGHYAYAHTASSSPRCPPKQPAACGKAFSDLMNSAHASSPSGHDIPAAICSPGQPAGARSRRV